MNLWLLWTPKHHPFSWHISTSLELSTAALGFEPTDISVWGQRSTSYTKADCKQKSWYILFTNIYSSVSQSLYFHAPLQHVIDLNGPLILNMPYVQKCQNFKKRHDFLWSLRKNRFLAITCLISTFQRKQVKKTDRHFLKKFYFFLLIKNIYKCLYLSRLFMKFHPPVTNVSIPFFP